MKRWIAQRVSALLLTGVSCLLAQTPTNRVPPRPITIQPRPSASSGSPSYSSFSPTQASVGSTITLTFSGANFVARAMNLIFTPSQGLTVSNLQAISSTQITAQVQIAATAQLGNRQVELVDADHALRISTPFTIIAAPQNNCPPGMLTATGCSLPPTLREFSPVQGLQGARLAITFTGMNFTAPATVLFTPNAGISVQSVAVTGANQIQAQIAIASNAPIGSRAVVVTIGGQSKLTAPNTFTVISAAPPAHFTPMQILRVIPNQIAAGSQNVDLTLEGSGFTPGTLVTFTTGAGVPAAVIANGPARYFNSTEMHVSVNTLPTALPGGRDINLRSPGLPARPISTAVNGLAGQPAQPSIIGKGMLNVLASKPSGPPSVLKIPPISIQKFSQGVISLDAPIGQETTSDGYVTSIAVPLLDDNSVFKWHEQDPGLADYYELRVYSKDGKTLLITQKITGRAILPIGGNGAPMNVVPTYYRPDPAFLKTILDPVRSLLFGGGIHLSGVNGAQQTPAGGPSKPTKAGDMLNAELNQGDLQWEVAGFHTYNKNGVSPQTLTKQIGLKPAQNASALQNQQSNLQSASQTSGGTTDVQVEVSERWPLKAPAAPNGLTCNGNGMTTGSLQVQNLSKTSNDPNSYVGDNWALGGTLDLSRSPYQPDATPHFVTPPNCGSQCLVRDVSNVSFSNVFVDWGDGTVVPFSAPPVGQNVTNWDPSQPLGLPSSGRSPIEHAYHSTGQFIVRVYQISNDDLQHVSESSISSSIDGPTTPFLQAALLSKMTAQGGLNKSGLTVSAVQSNFHQLLGGSNGNSAASQAANDAYMLYCQPLNITVPEDLEADGPLHLKAIADPDFGAYDISGRKPVPDHLGLGDQIGTPAKPGQSAAVASIRPQTITPTGQGKTNSNQGSTKLLPIREGQLQPIAICSTCDDGIDATTTIQYYGRGQVRVTWTVDGVQSQQMFPLGPSTARKNLSRQGYDTVNMGGISLQTPIPEPPIIVSNSKPIYSTALGVQPVGDHTLSVQAEVMPQPSIPNLSNLVGKALGSIMPSGLKASTTGGGASSTSTSSAPNVAEAQSLLNTLAPPAGSNLPPLKIGVLSGSNHSTAGLGAVQYLNNPLQKAVSQLTSNQPDQHVASKSTAYEVVASDPKKPCKFLFPVKSGGTFEISGLQSGVAQQGSTYNGTGKLIIHMATGGSHAYQEYPPISVQINSWSVPDGQHVQTGSIDVSPNLQLDQNVPGVTGTITRLSGQAGGELDATLNVQLTDDTLRQPGELPVTWSGVQAELKANGDWVKDGLTLPTTLIGWSAFTMQSSAARLDLSHHDGDAAGPLCGNLSGGDWVGVRFPTLSVTPYTFNLVSGAALQPKVTDWGVIGSGLCGKLNTGPFTANIGAGSVSFQSIVATASNGSFDAQYNGMDVHVPWLDTDLKGNADLLSGGGKQANMTFPLTAANVTRNYNNLSFTASNLTFTQEQNVGWVVQANTHFVFTAQNKSFSSFDQVFYFGMNGRGYFAQGNTSKDISLGGGSILDQTPVELASVHLTAPALGTQVLTAMFNANVHLSEVMAAAQAQVNYAINNNGNSYSATGPSFAPFTIDVPYPAGQPSSDAKVHPVYSGSGGSGGDEISGSVDLSELGGPPITGEFRLGYQGGHDYWLTRVTYSLGAQGLPIIAAPPLMNLYRVQGGIGHNFPISAFEDAGSLKSAVPSMDNSFLFMAGIRIGMPDQFTYTIDGDLSIKAGGQDAGARLDFQAWLLKQASGNGDFQGFLQYAGGNFDARLWGHLSLLGGVAAVDLGNSANNAAVDLHFGSSGPWHIDAGKQQGPRISGTLLGTTASMYFMLSDAGLAVGGGESIDLEVGDDSVASAYVRGDVDAGLAISPQPHISGDFSASVSAGVCVDSVCVSAGVSAQVHAEALPVDLEASASIGLPWPLGSISFSVHL